MRLGLPDFGLPQLLQLRDRSFPLSNSSRFLPSKYILYKQPIIPECAVEAVSLAASQYWDSLIFYFYLILLFYYSIFWSSTYLLIDYWDVNDCVINVSKIIVAY
jgi:hypothetical protein